MELGIHPWLVVASEPEDVLMLCPRLVREGSFRRPLRPRQGWVPEGIPQGPERSTNTSVLPS